MIKINNVYKSFNDVEVLKDITLEIKKGEAIGQALFQKYLITDNDKAEGKRMGGFGSTRK
mgnify:CR=1 FL=1